nr:hypothetical protein JVH1_0146 [Rhodococcus sp. JVH1]
MSAVIAVSDGSPIDGSRPFAIPSDSLPGTLGAVQGEFVNMTYRSR